MKPLIRQEKTRKVYIIRHGNTKLNGEDRIRGWSDIPLDVKGFSQAEKLGYDLRNKDIDVLISSDLTRALQTSQIVSIESGIPIIATSMALRPLNVGEYTGEPADKVHPLIMKHALEKPDVPFKDGESFDAFRYRYLIGAIALLNEYSDKTVAFVTHHRNDRMMRGWSEAGCPDDLSIDMTHFLQHGISPGSFDVLELHSNLII